MNLGEKKCQPCEGGIPPLDPKQIEELRVHIKSDWKISENKKLIKEYSFVNYRHTLDFVNKAAEVAEALQEFYPEEYYSNYVNNASGMGFLGVNEVVQQSN